MITSSSKHYKRTHMGMLPGDYPKFDKIKMLEQGILDLGYCPWHNPSKKFREVLERKALKRFRANEKNVIADSMGS